MYLHGTSKINEQGHLEIGGCDTVELANKFGTPLFVYDEVLIRQKCRDFMHAFKDTGLSFQVAYASKAFMSMAMCRLVAEEGLSLDVVSGGELYTALKADFPADRIHFHGNNKTPDEIEMALDAEIGCFVVDNFYELELLHALAKDRKKKVNILLRLTPGVSAHTHEYISTGQDDSKFGFSVTKGQALEGMKQALTMEYFNVLGIHSHIGSQIFETNGFVAAVAKLSEFLFDLRQQTGYELKVLNLGGGFGIRYTNEDTPLKAGEYIQSITNEVRKQFQEAHYTLPEIWIEPGRSIVGDAGTTLYKTGSVKTIPGIRKYISVDGGMTDNIRPALYQSRYEAMLANRAGEAADDLVSVAGKCCESGDMLIWDINLPTVNSGDILAVSCTGAYGYAMANNYNRITRPAVVFVKDGNAEIVVERETYDDIVKKDRIPASMMITK
ncbi:diaminopimelate decarboxylase [Ammoniphilus sp. CFH 90114]|uniref:diaminopimelate decarboxylase n=1 Tax=Ammoniphilus sp. CFH 90114 TaxID=2493665 RepID=UPI00100FC94A|nr:diaminopimelate decarboxylase [Ammoniphilus sp. CFH 90114]RXT13844.1 diaminopimelate decarboxylase [Ammoniphilus sp. CFH 90114]